MSYKVDYSAMQNRYVSYSNAVSTWSDGISFVMQREQAIEASKNISGNSASRMRQYLSTSYSCAKDMLSMLLNLFERSYLLYTQAYYQQIDPASDTHIDEAELGELHSKLQERRGQLQKISIEAENTAAGVADLVSLPSLDISSADAQLGCILTSLDELDNAVNGLESVYASSTDLAEIDAMISQLEGFFQEMIGLNKEFKTNFSAEGFMTLASVPALIAEARRAQTLMEEREAEVSVAVKELEKRREDKSNSVIPKDRKVVEKSVSDFEAEHPEYAAAMDKVLSDPDLTAQERLGIKYTAYNAPEPYRSIYFEHIDQYVVNVDPERGRDAFYRGTEGKIYMGRKGTLSNDPRGAYATFFHESGHAIDDYEYGNVAYDDGSLTNTYSYNGTSLHDLIVSDTRSYVEAIIDNDPKYKNLTETQHHIILRSLNLTDDAPMYDYDNDGNWLKDSFEDGIAGSQYKFISKYLKHPWEIREDVILEDVRRDIRQRMNNDLQGWDNEAASDVFGGVTNNAIKGDISHSSPHYWYGEDKMPKGSQERELWAEFFSAQMTQDEAALESIRRHFPQAYAAMEAMAQEMVAN